MRNNLKFNLPDGYKAQQLISELADQSGAMILSVDNEHSAVFQALKSGSNSEIRRIVLTASGGPFRDFESSEMNSRTSLVNCQVADSIGARRMVIDIRT